jgi:retron-type reverse transcriptase
VLTKLTGIAEVARLRPKEKFTSLAHLINADMLRMCHNEMDGKKATRIDAVTKESYNQNLDENLVDLISRMKRQAYWPQPVRRTYIPKPGSSQLRALGIPAYEEKLVQSALPKILVSIYEQEFLDSHMDSVLIVAVMMRSKY